MGRWHCETCKFFGALRLFSPLPSYDINLLVRHEAGTDIRYINMFFTTHVRKMRKKTYFIYVPQLKINNKGKRVTTPRIITIRMLNNRHDSFFLSFFDLIVLSNCVAYIVVHWFFLRVQRYRFSGNQTHNFDIFIRVSISFVRFSVYTIFLLVFLQTRFIHWIHICQRIRITKYRWLIYNRSEFDGKFSQIQIQA